MDRLELELRDAMRRREPPAGLRERIMGRVREERTEESQVVEFRPRRRMGIWSWRWAAAGAVAASLTVGTVVMKQRQNDVLAAQAAAAELEEALFFAGTKIHKARNAVWGRGEGGER